MIKNQFYNCNSLKAIVIEVNKVYQFSILTIMCGPKCKPVFSLVYETLKWIKYESSLGP